MAELLLGIDVGTTNIKAVLATPNGQVVSQAQTHYPIHHPRPGWAEQDPADWWQGVVVVTRQAITTAAANPDQIRGIGVSGQGCAVTLIDAGGEVVRPAIIWMDSRSESQCAQLRATCLDAILQRNGKQPAPYNADPVLMWLQQHEPESIARAHCSLTTTGYINFRLTGAPVENVSDASILFAFDLLRCEWSDELVAAFGLPRRLYPATAACTERIGSLTNDAALALSLRPGTPVVAGGEDTSSAGLAIGVVQPGQALLSLGTAGTLYVAQHEPMVHPDLLAFLHVLPMQTLLGGSMAAVGAALSWCRQLLAPQLEFSDLLKLAERSAPGADGLLFLPYLSGELQPINDGNARGVFFGMSMSTDQGQLVRAVVEGAAFAIAHNLQIARETGAAIDEIRAVGGPTRSAFWSQIIADVTGQRLAVLANNAGAPLGDALLAGTGVGLIADPAAVATASAHITQYFEPRSQYRERYDDLFAIYRQLYPDLKERFATLAAINR